MLEKVLKELIKNKQYCIIETGNYPLEGFVTGLQDDFVEMYVYSSKEPIVDSDADLDDSEIKEVPSNNENKRGFERVVFPITHIEYVFPDHYLRLPLNVLETRKLLVDQILSQRKQNNTKTTKTRKPTTASKRHIAKNK